MDDVIINIEQKESEANVAVKPAGDLVVDIPVDATSLKQLIFAKLGISNSSNPFVCIFHVFFKSLAVFFYLFSGFTFDSATVFLLVSIFGVLDFWVVKNISGRFFKQLFGRFALVVDH